MKEVQKAISAATHDLIKAEPFYGCLLQELNFRVNNQIETACLRYDVKKETFEIDINEKWFIAKSREERKQVLLHEVLHFTHNHIMRFMDMKPTSETDKKLQLLSADIAINQYIPNLPKEAVSLDFINEIYKMNLPKYRAMEEYFKHLKQIQQQQQQDQKNGKGKGDKKEGKGTPNVEDLSEFDEHPWDEVPASDEEKQAMLKEMKGVLKRTVEKSQYGFSSVPDFVKDLLQELDVKISRIDYKRILKETIKRTLAVNDREYSWRRPSKRFGSIAPGTTVGKLPSCDMYIDTSGSISHTEMNEFLEVVSGFLKVGAKKCNLGFWHTALYRFKKYKVGTKVDRNDVQAGGTDPDCVLEKIKKSNPDLAIILTDGEYYGQFKGKLTSNVLWVISKNGNANHCYKTIGKTIKMS